MCDIVFNVHIPYKVIATMNLVTSVAVRSYIIYSVRYAARDILMMGLTGRSYFLIVPPFPATPPLALPSANRRFVLCICEFVSVLLLGFCV